MVKRTRELSANQFPKTYVELGMSLDKLGCVMLELDPIENAGTKKIEGIEESLYYAKNKDRFWIDGWVIGKRPHLTLLYGLMESAQTWKTKVDRVLYGWHPDLIKIQFIGYFDSPYKDEDYWCIVARIKVTRNLLEGHQRLSFLPHIDTFNTYKPHVTICYIDKKMGVKYRQEVLKQLDAKWKGKIMRVKGIDYGK